jgi:hypothetical protein
LFTLTASQLRGSPVPALVCSAGTVALRDVPRYSLARDGLDWSEDAVGIAGTR